MLVRCTGGDGGAPVAFAPVRGRIPVRWLGGTVRRAGPSADDPSDGRPARRARPATRPLAPHLSLPPRDPVDQPPELISVIELSWISMPFGSFNVAIRPN